MANGKDRRKIRRLLQEVGLGWLLKIQEKPVKLHFWQKIPRWIYASLVGFSLLIAVLQSYPWLTVHEGTALDPQNPYTILWDVENDGYIPITNLTADCIPGALRVPSAHAGMGGMTLSFGFADYLGHSGSATVPCFRIFDNHGANVTPGQTFTVRIEYAFLYLNLPKLRRSQTFVFESMRLRNGPYRWIRKS